MQVKHILGDKGREVIAIRENASVMDAAILLSARNIGAVVVRDAAGGLAGIFSEREIVRALAREGLASLERTVDTYMTRAVITCTEQDAIDELMETMTNGRFRHMPVMDGNGSLVGVVSIGDVVKSRIAETVMEAQSLREYISA